MKINILSIAVLILTVSCQTDDKIQGTWIGAYSVPDKDDFSYLPKLPIRQIITFKKDSSFYHDNAFDTTFYYTDSYVLTKNNSLIFGKKKDTIDIQSIHHDSLVIHGNQRSLRVYKKLIPEWKFKNSYELDLIGNTYLVDSKYKKDTIHFLNDSIYILKNGSEKNRKIYWDLVCHNEYEILFIEHETCPLVIRDNFRDSISVTALHEFEYTFNFVKLD